MTTVLGLLHSLSFSRLFQIPFGVVRSDRGDCGGDKCDPTIETDYGAPVWSDIDGLSEE